MNWKRSSKKNIKVFSFYTICYKITIVIWMYFMYKHIPDSAFEIAEAH